MIASVVSGARMTGVGFVWTEDTASVASVQSLNRLHCMTPSINLFLTREGSKLI
jgi:hypothetical protein